jgi:hypothetical protein
LKNLIKNQKAVSNAFAAIAIVAILVVGAFGYFMYINPPAQNQLNPGGNGNTNPTIAPSGSFSGQLYLSVSDSITKVRFTTSTVTVSQVGATNGVFNFLSGPQLSLTQSANPQAEGKIWAQGTPIIVMVACTGNPSNGLAYYPVWYYTTLNQGAPIYEITSASAFQQVGNGYTINLAGCTQVAGASVQEYAASNINYWNMGDLYLYPRTSAAGLNEILQDGSGTTLASVTDGSTWVTTAPTANTTLASSNNDVLQLRATFDNTNLCWGKTYFGIDQAGMVHTYGGVVVVATGILSMSAPSAAGPVTSWNNFGLRTLTNEVAYYGVVNANVPAKGNKADFSIPIAMHVQPDSTKYKFSVWLMDGQDLGTIGTSGTTTTIPTAYGFIGAYGVAAVVQNDGLTVSSGASATPQLCTWITTPSS